MATESIAEHEIAALARPILEDRFRNQIEILSVRTGQHQGRLTMDVSYRGDPAALHPQRFKGISRRIRPQLQAMGMRDQLIERYTQTTDEEWNARAQAPHGQTTDGEWSELVQATTEIDTSLPIDRAEFERLAEEWLEQRPRGVDVAQMIRDTPPTRASSTSAPRPSRGCWKGWPKAPITGSTPSTRSPTRNRYNPNTRATSTQWPKNGSPEASRTSHR